MLRLAVNHLSLVVLVKGYLSALVRSGNCIDIPGHNHHPSDRRTLPNGLDFEKGFMFHFSRFNSDLSELQTGHLGTNVDIISHTSASNLYEVPSDGFAVLQLGDSVNYQASIIARQGDTNYYLAYAIGRYTMANTFVKKGMKIYINAPSGGLSSATFTPLTLS